MLTTQTCHAWSMFFREITEALTYPWNTGTITNIPEALPASVHNLPMY